MKKKKKNNRLKRKQLNKANKNNSSLSNKQIELKHKKNNNSPKKLSKKYINRKKKYKRKLIKKIFSVAIIATIIITSLILGYNYIFEKYINKGNYIFQTNLPNTKVILSCSNNKYEDIKEKITNTKLYVSLFYDQIEIKNKQLKETITSDEPFFKYYGEKESIVPVGSKYVINYIYYSPYIEQKLEFISTSDCVKINDNIVESLCNGETTIYAYYGNTKVKLFDIISTDLIVTERPKEFDTSKKFLTCEQFTDEENNILDRIIIKKINDVGYLTRAGAVEALRFLTLDFSYRINYFNENGRLPYVDAEGRYYHKGLYLSKGKYNDLSITNQANRGTWGCPIFSHPAKTKEANGLDCSGLMCWALVNAGFDPEDKRGADLLLKLGELHRTKEIIDSGVIKVGDFVHNNEASSHIGMIIGIDDKENYYVAQAIWYKPNGVVITKHNKNEFVNHWLDTVLLDDYYNEDGKLTNMWY